MCGTVSSCAKVKGEAARGAKQRAGGSGGGGGGGRKPRPFVPSGPTVGQRVALGKAGSVVRA
jgi:hypothetical protein